MLTEVNIEARSAFKNGIQIICDGKAVNGYNIRARPVSIQEIERLYHIYKYSIPDENKSKCLFKALPIEQLGVKDFIKGVSRKNARFDLELTILEGILNKSLSWPTDAHDKWFLVSKSDPDLIFLKTWFNEEGSV